MAAPRSQSHGGRLLSRQELRAIPNDALEAELTIAAYAPGRRRWEQYQQLLIERSRRRPAAA